MPSYSRIAAGFAIVILMLIALGGFSYLQVREISKNIDDIYRHPFAVSNAAKSIDFHLVSMHRHMKDVVLANTPEQLQTAVTEVNKHEQAALKQFDVIFDRFLGEKAQVNRTYKAFIDWKVIRDEVIRLTRDDRKLEAAEITKARGADHVALLNSEVDALVKFAFSKAEEFHTLANEKEQQATVLIATLSTLSVIFAFAIAYFVLRNLASTTKDSLQRAHLIDQNIMMASLDIDGKVVDVSNALCRFLGHIKADLIGKPSGFFDNSEEAEQTQQVIWQTIHTGKEWNGEIKRIGEDGHVHWASSSVLPNYDTSYNLIGFTNILVDTTSKKLSVTDKLTALYNRRRYEEIIIREIRMAKRNEADLTLAIIDIDHFKNYNDHYGHPAGDQVLSRVAEQMLKSLKRPNDYVFRMGGEEFAVLFSGLGQYESEKFLNEIRQNIEDLAVEHHYSSAAEVLTVSVGGHVMHADGTYDEKSIYIMADKALYKAKETRNTVVVTS